MNREPIYAALFARLQGAYAWKTASRNLKHWSDVKSAMQPAMFMTQVSEEAVVQTGQKTRWFMDVKVYLYTHQSTQSGDLPAQSLNTVLDAITAAMLPDFPAVQEKQTLGGLVQYARIEGGIETDEGFLGDQAVAIVPIRILTAD